MDDNILDNNFETRRAFTQEELNTIREVRNQAHKLVVHIRSARIVCFILAGICLFIGGIGLFIDEYDIFLIIMGMTGGSAFIYIALGIFIKKNAKLALTIALALYSLFTLLVVLVASGISFMNIFHLIIIYFFSQGTRAAYQLPNKLQELTNLGVPSHWKIIAKDLQDLPTSRNGENT